MHAQLVPQQERNSHHGFGTCINVCYVVVGHRTHPSVPTVSMQDVATAFRVAVALSRDALQ